MAYNAVNQQVSDPSHGQLFSCCQLDTPTLQQPSARQWHCRRSTAVAQWMHDNTLGPAPAWQACLKQGGQGAKAAQGNRSTHWVWHTMQLLMLSYKWKKLHNVCAAHMICSMAATTGLCPSCLGQGPAAPNFGLWATSMPIKAAAVPHPAPQAPRSPHPASRQACCHSHQISSTAAAR